MKIGYPTLSPEQINSKECVEKAAELTAYVSEKIDVLTTHEAGHLFFARRADCRSAKPVGPFIYFEGGEYKYHTISVEVPEWKQKHRLPYTKELLAKIGDSLVAGGMFLEHFKGLPEKEWGDKDDYDRFGDYCLSARHSDIQRVENSFFRTTGSQWTDAQNRVRKILGTLSDLENAHIEKIKVEVKATAF